MDNILTHCTLCPRKCGANRAVGETGFCGASDKIKIARSALHFWEEPCISGENGSGTVFFSHCTMKCVFCQNYQISTQNRGYEITIDELSEIFLDLQNQGALNINLVTPTHYVPQIITALKAAKENGLTVPIVYNTSGYENVETLKMLDGLIDIYMPDMKYYSDKYAVKYSAAPRYFQIASDAIAEMHRQTGSPIFENGIMKRGVIVRHLMLPGLLFDTKKIMDYLYKTYGDDIYISIMSQYTPLEHIKKYPELDRKLNNKHYEAMVDYCAELGIKNAFIQEGEAALESFIPPFSDSKDT
jgi:putative pyruvate formate lyase activating enzyme